jgi:hypothetical protein
MALPQGPLAACHWFVRLWKYRDSAAYREGPGEDVLRSTL